MRPPCCNIDGIKKGPWTPEEDIVLIAYIQEHGAGNWSAVPATTGLLRCSKSCRLRWTNYLRPGIKRGNFTPREQGMIIHLQALLGNKWAAIASYLPQRTDNDIKNYWNTHLKKQQQQQIKKLQSATDNSPQNTKNSVHESSSPYALSAENISRLLQNWINSSSSSSNTMTTTSLLHTYGSRFLGETGKIPDDSCSPKQSVHGQELEKVVLFDRGLVDSVASSCDSSGLVDHEKVCIMHDEKPPLSFLENWLHDENGATQVGGEMEIPPLFWPAKESNVMI